MLLTVSECCGVGGDRLALSARLCQSTWLDGGHDQCQGWWCAPYTHPLCHARWQSSVNQHAPHTHQDAQGVARQASAMKMNRVSCGDFLAVVHNMVHSATLRPCLPTARVVDAHAPSLHCCARRGACKTTSHSPCRTPMVRACTMYQGKNCCRLALCPLVTHANRADCTCSRLISPVRRAVPAAGAVPQSRSSARAYE